MIWKVSRRSVKFPDDLKSVQIIQKMYAGLSWGFMLFQERVAQKQFWIPNFNFHFLTLEQEWFEWILGNFKSQIWDLYCKHCLRSIFGPCLCTQSCKTNFYAHLSRIWKLTQFTRFIRKVFATKILLSGKFSLFVTLMSAHLKKVKDFWKKLGTPASESDVSFYFFANTYKAKL